MVNINIAIDLYDEFETAIRDINLLIFKPV